MIFGWCVQSYFLTCIPRIDKDGTIWIGNSNGLLFTDSGKITKGRKYSYSLGITGVYEDVNKVIPVIRENAMRYRVELENIPKSLIIHFSAFTYTDPAYMSYEYQLEGGDTDWIKLTGNQKLFIMDCLLEIIRLKCAGLGILLQKFL